MSATTLKENKMGVMPIGKLLVNMALPMIVSMLVQALYNVVDSIYVSQISESAVTALSLAFPVQNMQIGFAVGVGVGVNSLLSKSLGEHNQEAVNRTAGNGVILMPGDVFSYNDSVGPRTYERGFKDATVYVGNSAEDGVGGGICQVSSTIYYAALRADLKIVERYAHSRMVTYVPLGEDATVAWGSKDFKFENNTDFPMKVVTSHKTNNLTVKLYGTQTVANKTVKIETTQLSKTPFEVVYEVDETLAPGTESVKSNGYTGYKTESYRVVYIDGQEVSRTFENKSTYKKYDKVILHNPAAAPITPVGPAPSTEETPGAVEPGVPLDPNWNNNSSDGSLSTGD